MSSVDVIVPCYNYGRFLRGAVSSVLAQGRVSVRVLILDDCSSDDSEAVGRGLAAEDRRVEFRRHAVNQGHIATYNEGLDWIAGDYCLLLSADDMLTPGALGRATAVMDQYPAVGMTYGEIIRTAAPDFSTAPSPPTYAIDVISGQDFIERCCRACSNLVETATAVVRTSVQKAIGGYRPSLPHAGDLEMWLRCASRGAIGRVDAPQGFYRRHQTNMSIGYTARKDVYQVRAAFDAFFREADERLPDGDRLEALYRAAMAEQLFFLANDAFDAAEPEQCRTLLAEATALWPGIRSHRGWARLRLKRLAGRRVWSLIRRWASV